MDGMSFTEPAALGALVAAITEGLKRRGSLAGLLAYALNLGLSLALALLLGYAGLLPPEYPFPGGAILFGIYAALSASGLYEAVKQLTKAVKGGSGAGPSGPAGPTGADRGRLR